MWKVQARTFFEAVMNVTEMCTQVIGPFLFVVVAVINSWACLKGSLGESKSQQCWFIEGCSKCQHVAHSADEL